MFIKICDIFIGFGILIILLLSPVMVGSVHSASLLVIFTITLLTFFVFILRSYKSSEFKIKNNHFELAFCILIVYTECQFLFNFGDMNSKFFFGSIYRYATLNELLKLVIYFVFFIIVANEINSLKKIYRVLWTIAFAAGLLSILGITQSVSCKNIIQLAGLETQKPFFSTFIYRNNFACYMELALPVILSLFLCKLIELKSKIKTSEEIKNKNYLVAALENGSVFILLLLLLIYASVFLSLSRAGMILITLGLFIFLIFYVRQKKITAGRKILFVALEGIIFLAVILIVAVGLDPIIGRYEEFQGFRIRIDVWLATLKLIFKYSFFGTGLGTFRYIFTQVQPLYPMDYFFPHAHNDYLEYFSGTGLVGFLIFFIGIINFFIRNKIPTGTPSSDYIKYSIIRFGMLTSIILIAIHNLVDFNMNITAIGLLFFAIVAVYSVSGQMMRDALASREIINLNSKNKILFIILPVYILISFSILKIQANILFSEKIIKDKHQGLVTRYKKAMALDPLNADYRYRLSSILYDYSVNNKKGTQALLEKASDEAEKAVELAPTNMTYLYNLATMYYLLGKWDNAEGYFSKTIYYAPTRYRYKVNFAIFYFNRAYISKNTKEKHLFLKKGVEQYEAAKKINPGIGLEYYRENFYDYEGQVREIKSYYIE